MDFREYQEQAITIGLTFAVSVGSLLVGAFLRTWDVSRDAISALNGVVFSLLALLAVLMIPKKHWLGGPLSRRERIVRGLLGILIVAVGLTMVVTLQRR